MCWSFYSPNTSANGMIINFHGMEYYFQRQLSQYSHSLEVGPYAVCFLAEERYYLSRTSDQPLAHLASCSVDVVDPSPALKELMHEAYHLSLFLLRLRMSAVVTVLPLNVLILIYLLTAIGLTPGGCSRVHIYTQTIHWTTQLTTFVGRLGFEPGVVTLKLTMN